MIVESRNIQKNVLLQYKNVGFQPWNSQMETSCDRQFQPEISLTHIFITQSLQAE